MPAVVDIAGIIRDHRDELDNPPEWLKMLCVKLIGVMFDKDGHVIYFENNLTAIGLLEAAGFEVHPLDDAPPDEKVRPLGMISGKKVRAIVTDRMTFIGPGKYSPPLNDAVKLIRQHLKPKTIHFIDTGGYLYG